MPDRLTDERVEEIRAEHDENKKHGDIYMDFEGGVIDALLKDREALVEDLKTAKGLLVDVLKNDDEVRANGEDSSLKFSVWQRIRRFVGSNP